MKSKIRSKRVKPGVRARFNKAREIPERWYEVFGMGGALPQDFSETDNINVLRIPGHYFMKF